MTTEPVGDVSEMVHPKNECIVCGDPFPQDEGERLDKFDPMQKVIGDDHAHHLGCTDGVMETVHCESDDPNYQEATSESTD